MFTRAFIHACILNTCMCSSTWMYHSDHCTCMHHSYSAWKKHIYNTWFRTKAWGHGLGPWSRAMVWGLCLGPWFGILF